MKSLMIALGFTMTLSSCDSNPSPLTYSGCDGKEIDGIFFEYCLLNSQKEVATNFQEGENFFIQFTVRNKTGKKYYFYPQYANDENNSFCTVYTADGRKLGKPYVLSALNFIGIGGFPFDHNDDYVFVQPWVDTRDSSWIWKHGTYSSTGQNPLPSGKYQTSFKETFRFREPYSDDELIIKDVEFRIDFTSSQ